MMKKLLALLALLFCTTVSAQSPQGPILMENGQYVFGGTQESFVVEKYPLSKSGYVDPYSHGTPVDCWRFDQAVGANYTGDCTGLTYVVNGAPTRVSDHTWPSGSGIAGSQGYAWGYAWSFDRADDGTFDMDLAHNPTGDFSVQCVVTPHVIAAPGATKLIMGKVTPAFNDVSFTLHFDSDDVVFLVTDTGRVDLAQYTAVIKTNSIATYRPTFITASYDYIGPGTSSLYLYVDDLGVASNVGGARGPVHDSARDFLINAGASGVDGLFHDCKLYKGVVISESEHYRDFAQWQGRLSADGQNFVSVSGAAMPAWPMIPVGGTEPFIIDQPANSAAVGAIVGAAGGILDEKTITSKWWRGSCETDDGAGDCQGWTHVDNGGAGTSTVVSDRVTTTSAHGGASVKFTTTAGTLPKSGIALSACQTQWIGQDVMVRCRGKTLSGVASCAVRIYEYDAANCTTYLAEAGLMADPGANWTKIKTNLAAASWNALTSSWRVGIRCNATGLAYEVAYDDCFVVQAPATFGTDASCTTDSDSDAVCSNVVYSAPSPVGANNPMALVATFRSPWAGTDLTTDAYLFSSGSALGANTYGLFVESTTDEPSFEVYDRASAVRTVAPNVLDWAADTSYTLRLRTGGKNDLGLYWNSSWQATLAGAGTGMRSAAQSVTYLGNDGTTPSGAWVTGVEVMQVPDNLQHLIRGEQMNVYP